MPPVDNATGASYSCSIPRAIRSSGCALADRPKIAPKVERPPRRRYPIHDVKVLWGLSAGRCAFPGCREICIAPAMHEDGPAVIGDIAHIVAHAGEGPRADPEFPTDQLDTYGNWIVLCANHHRLVDAQTSTYTVPMLREWKQRHEAWVVERLGRGLRWGMAQWPRHDEVLLYRIVRTEQDPWQPPTASRAAIGGRWDAPLSSYRVRYAASSAELALAEVFEDVGHITARDVANRMISSARVRGRFADLTHNVPLQQSLDERLAVLIGPVSPAELSFSADRRRTQEMSRLIFDDSIWDGIVYASRKLGPEHGQLYALFDSAELLEVDSWPLREYLQGKGLHIR